MIFDDDANIELDSHRSKVLELEKKQRNFDKILAEEKKRGEERGSIQRGIMLREMPGRREINC